MYREPARLWACPAIRFYRYKDAVDALFERTRRSPNIKNRADIETEEAVTAFAIDYPACGQARTSNELRKSGTFVSPSGVRSIWLRHDLANFKKRLKAPASQSRQRWHHPDRSPGSGVREKETG